MNENISERISVLVDQFGGGKNTVFAAKVGDNEANVRNYRSGKTTPKYSVLLSIVKNFDISTEWLLTGQGPMLRDSSTPSASAPEPIDEKSRLRGRIEQLECENERLRVRNEELISEAATLRQECGLLRAQAKASAASANSRTA